MMSGGDQAVQLGILIVYVAGLYWLGYRASQRCTSVEDYVLAGRRLPWLLSVLTLTATWFGAESMMTTANEVSKLGIRRAMLDPLGISLGLVVAGIYVAGPVRRLNALTIGDFFRQRFGVVAESMACWIMIPSYFGWIAAQLLALAVVFETIFGLPIWLGIVIIAIVGTGYGCLGGMWSASWTDAAQMLLIVIGLMVLTLQAVVVVGQGSLLEGLAAISSQTPGSFWRISDPKQPWMSLNEALGALAIGAIGNLPMQDLIQRLMAAENEKVAQRACYGAAALYLGMGMMPIVLGLVGSILVQQTDTLTGESSDIVMRLGGLCLPPILLMVLVLAIVSAVLSTLVSAILSPAALLAHNLAQPIWERRLNRSMSDREGLRLQRVCVVLILACSMAVALAGSSVYSLLEDSYALGLVGLAVPFLVGIRFRFGQQNAAIAAMISGMLTWSFHWWLDWDWFLQPWSVAWPIPQEVGATLLSLLTFVAFAAFPRSGSVQR